MIDFQKDPLLSILVFQKLDLFVVFPHLDPHIWIGPENPNLLFLKLSPIGLW